MQLTKKTKIIATIGPASDSKERIKELILAGVNIFRFNMKHNTFQWHDERVRLVRNMAGAMKMPIGILIDLQGPEIRVETKDQKDVLIKKGDKIIFSSIPSDDKRTVIIRNKLSFNLFALKDVFLIDDGLIEFKVVSKKKEAFVAEALEDGHIRHRKGINIPGKKFDMPSLIKEDIKKLEIAKRNKIDFIGLSFSRSKNDLEILKKEMAKRKIKSDIMAKIETQEALDNIDELIETADAVMVARGDLGIETPIEQLAYRQKEIIHKCRIAKKPVITATQMLQSMITSSRPTRAEATDVANAVFDGTDAVMLSEETSIGKYPVKAVTAMAKILEFNEKKAMLAGIYSEPKGSTQTMVNAAMAIFENQPKDKWLKITTAVVFTESGYTAKVLSSFRPKINVIAVTDVKDTVEKMTLSYGIHPIYMPSKTKAFKSNSEVIKKLKDDNLVRKGESAIIIHGRHRDEPGLVNSIALMQIK